MIDHLISLSSMNDTLESPPATAPRPLSLEFHEPKPNRMPLHLLLVIVSLPVAIVTLAFSLVFRLLGVQR